MNKLPDAERAQVIACICEENSIRSTVRLTGVVKNTITRIAPGDRRHPVSNTRIECSATSGASDFSVTRFGPSSNANDKKAPAEMSG